MFEITKKFVHETGFEITPFFMEGTGFVFLPKELEAQLGYENFAQTIFHSDSFKEGIEYIILRESNLLEFKELLNLSNSITSVLKEDFKHAPSLILLTESGLYTAMILSRKPNSENFRRWITCEVLPSIREKGYYLQEHQGDRKLSTRQDAITLSNDSGGFIKKIVDNLSIQIARFSESTENRLNQIEAVLAECRQNQDLFAGWKGIKMLVEDMTEIYKLTEEERRMYFTTVCQENGISLPEKAILEREPVFYDIKSIASMLGIYSTKSKPHIPFVTTLIAHLGLEKYKKPSGNVAKYSQKAVGSIQEWLIKHRYPQKIRLPCKKKDKAFEVKYLRKR